MDSQYITENNSRKNNILYVVILVAVIVILIDIIYVVFPNNTLKYSSSTPNNPTASVKLATDMIQYSNQYISLSHPASWSVSQTPIANFIRLDISPQTSSSNSTYLTILIYPNSTLPLSSREEHNINSSQVKLTTTIADLKADEYEYSVELPSVNGKSQGKVSGKEYYIQKGSTQIVVNEIYSNQVTQSAIDQQVLSKILNSFVVK